MTKDKKPVRQTKAGLLHKNGEKQRNLDKKPSAEKTEHQAPKISKESAEEKTPDEPLH